MTRALALAAILALAALPAGSAGAEEAPVERVLILSLPSVTWEGVHQAQEDGLPLEHLEALFDHSALANLVTRGVGRNPTPGAAYLTISSGTRSVGIDELDGQVFEVDEDFGADSAGEVFQRRTGEPPGQGGVVVAMPQLVAANSGETYEATLGLLASTLEDAELSRAVIANADGAEGGDEDPTHREAALALSDEAGRVQGAQFHGLLEEAPLAPYGTEFDLDAVVEHFDQLWPATDLVLVEASDLARAARYQDLAAPEQAQHLWEQALVSADELVGELLARVDPQTDAVLLLSPFHAGDDPALTIAALQAPGIEPRLLESALTHRAGYVTLTDVAPTVLDLLDVDQPDGMEGRPIHVAGGAGDTAARTDGLARSAARAEFRDEVSRPVSVAVAVYVALAAVLLGLGAFRGRRPLLQLVGLAGLGFLLSTHLAALLPFEDWGVAAYWPFLVATAGALAVAALLVGRRDRALTPLLLAAGLLWLTLVIDLILGAPLQLDTALGYSATVAFRFSGLGNFGFAELAGAAILVAGLMVDRFPGRRGRLLALVALVVALAVDGLPSMGADVGGVLAATPTFLLLIWLLNRRSLQWRRILALGLATAGLISALALFDVLRPAEQRTHLGRLVERMGDEGWDPLASVITRKLTGVADSLATPWAAATVIGAVAGLLLLRYRREAIHAAVAATPTAGPMATALVVGGVLGAVLNDSGVAVTAIMFMVLAAAALFVLAPAVQGSGGSPPSGSPSASRG
jgi:hypothetical protein